MPETVGGIFDLGNFSTIEITGKDTLDYLNRMSTVNFKAWSVGDVRYGAFLTGKGQVVSLGVFVGTGPETVQFVVAPPQEPLAMEHIEKFHFSEAFTATLTDKGWVGLWDPTAGLAKKLGVDAPTPMKAVETTWNGTPLLVWREERRPAFFWIRMERQQIPGFLDAVKALGINALEARLNRFLEIEAGIPRFGVEISDKELILEANFLEAVARNKGCYPGQEVVERIFTYGQVNKKLLGVDLAGKGLEGEITDREIVLGNEVVGSLASFDLVPGRKDKAVGLAYIGKKFWDTTDALRTRSGLEVTIRR